MRTLKIGNLRLRHTTVREQTPGVEQMRAFISSLSFGNQVARLMRLTGRRKVRVDGKILQRLQDPGH